MQEKRAKEIGADRRDDQNDPCDFPRKAMNGM
jgi:hypothetical protein